MLPPQRCVAVNIEVVNAEELCFVASLAELQLPAVQADETHGQVVVLADIAGLVCTEDWSFSEVTFFNGALAFGPHVVESVLDASEENFGGLQGSGIVDDDEGVLVVD